MFLIVQNLKNSKYTSNISIDTIIYYIDNFRISDLNRLRTFMYTFQNKEGTDKYSNTLACVTEKYNVQSLAIEGGIEGKTS